MIIHLSLILFYNFINLYKPVEYKEIYYNLCYYNKCQTGYVKGVLNMFEKLEKLQIITLAVILAVGIIAAAKIITGTFSKDTITVTGSAYQIVKSDSARLEFNITTSQKDRASAYNQAQKQLPVVIKYLEQKGISKDDIELSPSHGYYTYKKSPNGNITNEVENYNHFQPVIITSKDVDKIKDISIDIDKLIAQGIEINVIPPLYFYSQISDLKVKLLEDATVDAKERAAAMLKATNNRVGKIQSVRMGVFQITPADSTNVSDYGINDTTTIDKKVTSVANVVFRVK